MAYCWAAIPICRNWLLQEMLSACSLARPNAGSRTLISRAMMPMTTSNSTNVNADMRFMCIQSAAKWLSG
jgi:hypothetical protein